MEFLAFVLNGLCLVIIIDTLSTWVVQDPRAFPRNITTPITEPMYQPLRAILKPEMTGGLDFSPFILVLALQSLARALTSGAGFGA